MLFNQIAIEAIVAGGNGRVSGEYDFARDPAYGFVKADAFFLHTIANGFQNRKCAVAFIEVQHAGRDSHGFQSTKTANTKKQLLADPYVAVATVQTRRESAIVRSVALDVGIKEEEIATSNAHAPDAGANGTATRFNLHGHRLAFGIDGRLHRQLRCVGRQVLFLLPALNIEPLAEVALSIENADANQRNAEIRGTFDVVAGEHSEAA